MLPQEPPAQRRGGALSFALMTTSRATNPVPVQTGLGFIGPSHELGSITLSCEPEGVKLWYAWPVPILQDFISLRFDMSETHDLVPRFQFVGRKESAYRK